MRDRESPAGGTGRRRPSSSRCAGTFVPALVREACRKRGFSNTDIVLRWREIVGPALADHTWPVRIEWPKRQEAMLRPDGTAEPGGQRTRLVVAATPARALDVEYSKRTIVERVNRYLGYRAITDLTASPDYTMELDCHRQAPATRGEPEEAPTDGEEKAADPLKAALARLGRSVSRRGF